MGKEYIGELQVASKGILDGDTFPEGKLHVEPWGTQEERLLISPNIDYDETINRLIVRLTDCPLPPEDLLLADRQHIFIYMRCLSYGGDYSFFFKCSECREKVKHPMNLEKDLDVKYADDPELLRTLGCDTVEDLQEPFEFILPLQQKKVGWRLLRGKDEQKVKKYVKRMTKKHGSDERYDYIYRAALRTEQVDGQSMPMTDALTFITSLKGKDALAIRQAVDQVDFGIDTEIEAVCRNCGYPNDIIMPIDKSFFRPERSVI
jgi:hypothetical protein